VRQRSVPRGVLDVAVSQIGLKGTGIMAVIRQLITAGVAEHVSMRFDAQTSACALAYLTDP
jgi:hypothetical protein